MAHCTMPPVARAPRPEIASRRRFHLRLLGWYRRHQRELPWRRTADPYHILGSEIMLQQTQVDRVIPKYHEFLARYPTLESLAEAETAEVKRTWYPLGYNVRPLNLQGIARETLARYDGRLPDDAGALRSMRGIGRYTAGAILSFAYRQDAALVDTNVRRVLGRIFLGPRRSPRPAQQSLRLQPSPHGLRRNVVHGSRPPLPALPNEALLRDLSHAAE